MIKFIYFDVGGVFVDFHNVFKKVTTDFKIPMDVFLQQWDEYNDDITRGKIKSQEFWNKVRTNLSIKEGADYNFLKSWISDYICVQPMFDYVKELAKSYKVGMITNLYEGMFPILVKERFVPDLPYSVIITSCDVGMKKPNRDIYEYAQKKAKVNPSEILLVDDREDFVKGAKDCGWQTIQFQSRNPEISIQEMKNLLK